MTVVFKVSDNVKSKMLKYYDDRKDEKIPPYALFQVKDFDCVTTLYESGKIVFQGIGADIEASLWIEQERILNNRIIDIEGKEKEKKDKKDDFFFNMNTIGSDEVGTGDYFGPIVVSAAYVAKSDFNFLTDLGVKDSKKLTDDKIIKIVPDIIKKIPHTTIILDNLTYNKNYSSDINMNKVKAILHNKALLNLIKNNKLDYQKIVVDQFVFKNKYFEHIKEVPQKVTNITFTTKAEDKCLSVAVASIISRYIFLKEMKKLSTKLEMELPKGAGALVDEVGKELIAKYGESILESIAKINFKNTSKIKK